MYADEENAQTVVKRKRSVVEWDIMQEKSGILISTKENPGNSTYSPAIAIHTAVGQHIFISAVSIPSPSNH